MKRDLHHFRSLHKICNTTFFEQIVKHNLHHTLQSMYTNMLYVKFKQHVLSIMKHDLHHFHSFYIKYVIQHILNIVKHDLHS